MSKVWSLFKDLGDMTPSQLERVYSDCDYSHTLDIVRAALNGAIPLTEDGIDDFNLQAYEYKCKENEKNGKYKRAKDVLNIVDFDNSEEDGKVGYGDVSDRKIKSIEDSYEEIMKSEEFEQNIKTLYDIRTKYIVEKGVDLVSILIGSLKGIPEAVLEVKNLIQDSYLKDLIVSLCECSKDGKLLRVLEATS